MTDFIESYNKIIKPLTPYKQKIKNGAVRSISEYDFNIGELQEIVDGKIKNGEITETFFQRSNVFDILRELDSYTHG